MSHGENAEKRGRSGYEWGSKRPPFGWVTPGRITKWITHRRERREARRLEREIAARTSCEAWDCDGDHKYYSHDPETGDLVAGEEW